MTLTVPQYERIMEAAFDVLGGPGTWMRVHKESKGNTLDAFMAYLEALQAEKDKAAQAEAKQAAKPPAPEAPKSLTAQYEALTDPIERGKFIVANEAGLLAEMDAQNQAATEQDSPGKEFPLTVQLRALTDPFERGRFIEANERGLMDEAQAMSR